MGLKKSGLRGSLQNVSVVIYAIPDIENVQELHRSEDIDSEIGSTINSWPDASNNDFNLDTVSGSPTLEEDSNGNRYVLFDIDDYIFHSDEVSNPQPSEIWIKAQLETTDGSTQFIHAVGADEDASGDAAYRLQSNNGNFAIFSGEVLTGGSEDANLNTFGSIFDGSNSVLEINGTEQATGDAGDRFGEDSFYLGANVGGGSGANVRVYEVIVYQNRDDDRRSNIRDYLSRHDS